MMELRKIRDRIVKALEDSGAKADPYTVAHLTETRERIGKALDAQYIYNAKDLARGGSSQIIIISPHQGETPEPPADR